MKKEEVFIDLSKCTEYEQKHIISLLPPTKTNSLEIFEESVYLHYIEYWGKWVVDDKLSIKGKTGLTYPEFIQLFEGGEGENETSLQIAIKALENIINPIGYMKSQLEEGDTLNGGDAIMLAEKPQFYQNIAEEALRKINSK